MKNNVHISTISKKIAQKPNNTKPDFLKILFAAFVKTNRAPNGRATGVTYWLHSQYKQLFYHLDREHEKKEDCFLQCFISLLQSLQAKGMLIYHLLTSE